MKLIYIVYIYLLFVYGEISNVLIDHAQYVLIQIWLAYWMIWNQFKIVIVTSDSFARTHIYTVLIVVNLAQRFREVVEERRIEVLVEQCLVALRELEL